jgi:hypothetical protein
MSASFSIDICIDSDEKFYNETIENLFKNTKNLTNDHIVLLKQRLIAEKEKALYDLELKYKAKFNNQDEKIALLEKNLSTETQLRHEDSIKYEITTERFIEIKVMHIYYCIII